jgi:hypothetical protein
MNPAANLPDNLKSRISRLHVAKREFKDDSGKTVNYTRLVIEVSVKNEPVEIEFKVDKKDLLLLGLADVLELEKAF